MKKLKITLALAITLLATQVYSQGGWNYVSNSGTSFNLHGMSFPPGQSNTGFACGMEFDWPSNGIIIKTTDGGDTWSQIWPVSGTVDGLKSIWFINDNVGFACGWNNYFIKTTDGGSTWTDVSGVTNVNRYMDIVFYDDNNGALACFPDNPTIHPAVFITDDGGNTWTPANNIATPDIEGICYASQDSLFAVGTTSTVYISTDGGLNWSTKSTLNDILYGVDFANSNFGVVAGQEHMYTTTDGGDTWTSNYVSYESYYGTKAFDDGTAYVAGTVEDIYVTSNYGGNWILDNDGSGTSTLSRIRFAHDGTAFSCGSQGTILTKAPLVQADFTSDIDTICEGGNVNFSDISGGSIVSWNWTFEGGTPSTSSSQNPSVNYPAVGTYDVKLVVSDGTFSDSITKQNYITVVLTPGQPNTPMGADSACAGSNIDYTTNAVQDASSYEWEVNPSNAGSMIGNDTIATFQSSTSFSGAYTIKVRAVNVCGPGAWSGDFQGTSLASPSPFQMIGDGAYCEGSQGAELGLDGSEAGVDYELYLDNVPTGNIQPGTGSPIYFDLVTDEGIYTTMGTSSGCTEEMVGNIWVHMINVPGQAATPQGPDAICNDTTTVYTTSGATDADSLIWILDPANAGIMTPSNEEVTIDWSADFSGIAMLSVQGENQCGTGDPSDELEIEVYETPDPQISGDTLTCEYFQNIIYSTQDNPNNTYSWEVHGGTIASGAGTHEISVNWGAAGMGWVKVTEENPEGCVITTNNYDVIIDECTGLSENKQQQIMIYPNPACDVINIHMPDQGFKNVKILNMMGQEVINRKPYHSGSSHLSVNISNLDKGIYYIIIVDESMNSLSGKFIKSK